MLTTVAAGRVYSFSHAVGRDLDSGPGFVHPIALALGQSNVAYVISRSTEILFATRVSKISIGVAGDEEFICEFGHYGEGDGNLTWPTSVALDRVGRVYVADEWLNRISIFDADGKFLGKWGIPGAGDGELNRPAGLAFDREENLNIVDSANNRVQKFTKEGTYLAKFGEEGSGEGQFNMPWGITTDNRGDVYVAGWKNHRVQKFSPDGIFLASFGTFGEGVGELNHPSGVAVDCEGDIYVADWANHRVQVFAPDGDAITSLIGDAVELSKWALWTVEANPDMIKARRRVKSLEREWRLCYPAAVAFDEAESRIIVADSQRGRLQIYVKDKGYVDPQFNL